MVPVGKNISKVQLNERLSVFMCNTVGLPAWSQALRNPSWLYFTWQIFYFDNWQGSATVCDKLFVLKKKICPGLMTAEAYEEKIIHAIRHQTVGMVGDMHQIKDKNQRAKEQWGLELGVVYWRTGWRAGRLCKIATQPPSSNALLEEMRFGGITYTTEKVTCLSSPWTELHLTWEFS